MTSFTLVVVGTAFFSGAAGTREMTVRDLVRGGAPPGHAKAGIRNQLPQYGRPATALNICGDVMTSDRTLRIARRVLGSTSQWQVSWLPLLRLDHNGAITAMMLIGATRRRRSARERALAPGGKLGRRTRPDHARLPHRPRGSRMTKRHPAANPAASTAPQPGQGSLPEAQDRRPAPPATRLACFVDELVLLAGLSRDLLYDQMRQGHLGYRKAGRRRVITRLHPGQLLGPVPRQPTPAGAADANNQAASRGR